MSTPGPHSYLVLMESFCISGVEIQILLCNNWLANYQCVVCFQVICHDSITGMTALLAKVIIHTGS